MDILKTEEVKNDKAKVVTTYVLEGVFLGVTVNVRKKVTLDGEEIQNTVISGAANENIQDASGIKDLAKLDLAKLIEQAKQNAKGK